MPDTKVFKIDSQNIALEPLEQAANLLKRGALVIIPTDTVYGIAANSQNRKAMDRLFEVKQRTPDKPFPLLIEKKEKVEELARDIPIAAYKLIDKFWPGALTIILKAARGNTIGLRMPNNQVALKIIELTGASLACPSANLSGKAAPQEFSAALTGLNGKVDAAIDAGSTVLGAESTVVDLSSGQLQVLREGAVKRAEIEQVITKKNVLFVCTGNSCRSVMAKALLEKKLKEAGRKDVEVSSAGVMGLNGMSATQATKGVLAKEGCDVSGHHSQGINRILLNESDLILVMEKLHEEKILQVAPEIKNRVFLLKEFAKINNGSLDVEDPIGLSLEFYQHTLNLIKEAIERIVKII
ncbi:MAG: L-threonylcarbamoyladenylate synthase [Candidatus Omnitrophica bacterium]|nr:L-threonylcarbamoyladenylate synthase [Candidatus Omnitrophota bacterium]MDD5653099.1 L-threonylcarbamoyladenylate synthase [Candidatus Omnitrophota bacterium]